MAVESSRTGTQGGTPAELLAIAQAVREGRRRHGMTQAELAGLAGTGLRFISELERGKPSLAINKVIHVLAALGLRLHVSAEQP